MAKKIKTFNVDEGIYNSLVKMFKRYNVDVSLSSYVNGCLNTLLVNLKDLEEGLRHVTISGKKLSVPMSFIINSIVANKGVPKDYDDDEADYAYMKEFVLTTELEDWQYDYDSQKRKIPVQFMRLLASELYDLSPDKKYLIEKKTGKKYIAGKTRNTIIEVKGKK